MPPVVIPYRSKPWVMALAALFFAGIGVVIFKRAQTNDRGLIINGIIHFETGGATVFYWILTAFCAGFVLVAMLGLIRAFGKPREVVLDDRTLSAPRNGISRTIVTVPLTSITGIDFSEVSRQRFLDIRHTHGKLSIPASMLPSANDIQLLAMEIAERRLAAVKADASPPAPDPASPPRPFGRRGL